MYARRKFQNIFQTEMYLLYTYILIFSVQFTNFFKIGYKTRSEEQNWVTYNDYKTIFQLFYKTMCKASV